MRLGTLTRQAAAFLEAAVVAGLNILVAGGTQSGKTTMLNCLAAAIPPRERVVTCEEVFELKIPLRDVASMQVRQPSLEGTGEVPLRRLVKEALRMRPVAHHRRRGAPGREPRSAHRAQQWPAGHVHHPCQQRPRGGDEDVHAAAAGRGERRKPVRRPDRGGVDRHRRPRGPRAGREAPGARDRRRAWPGRRARSSRSPTCSSVGAVSSPVPTASRRISTASNGRVTTSPPCSLRGRHDGAAARADARRRPLPRLVVVLDPGPGPASASRPAPPRRPARGRPRPRGVPDV